jgi:hypothetical protein
MEKFNTHQIPIVIALIHSINFENENKSDIQMLFDVVGEKFRKTITSHNSVLEAEHPDLICIDSIKTREEAELYLKKTNKQVLVRPSSRGPNYLGITFVADEGAISHSLIIKNNNQYYFENDPTKKFNTIFKLIKSFPIMSNIKFA